MTDEPEQNFPVADMSFDETLSNDEPATDGELEPILRVRERREDPPPPENSSLTADDTDAESDLSRPSRAVQFRIQRRSQVSTAIPALLLIAIGILYLVRPAGLTGPAALGIGLGAIALSLITRFLLNTRRERGLFFVGTLLLLWGAFAAAVLTRLIDFLEMWPLLVIAVGAAMVVTFVFERSHDRGLLFPAGLLIVAGGVALPFTMDYLSSSVLAGIARYWPVFFLLMALALLPRAIHDRTD